MTISIRNAAPTDAGAVSVLLGQLGYQTPPEEVRRRLDDRRLLDGVLIAETDGKVSGLLAHSQPIARLAEGTPSVRVTALVVDDRARTKGVGAALMAAAEERAHAVGATLIELTSSRRREAANRFYPRMGYADASTTSALYRKNLGEGHR